MRTLDRPPTIGDTVVVDDPRGAFHGLVGQVDLLDLPRRPLPWIRVQFDPAPRGCEAGVLFVARELVVLGQ
jgi:hypothetical protein